MVTLCRLLAELTAFSCSHLLHATQMLKKLLLACMQSCYSMHFSLSSRTKVCVVAHDTVELRW